MSKRDKYARAIAALDRLYAAVPAVPCRRLCGEACGPVILTDLEARRLQVASHVKPRTLPMIASGADLRCIYLTPAQDGCTVHAIRPLICRVWGALKRLSCPHGCVPERWISDSEFVALAIAVEKIGGGRVLRTGPEGLGHVPGERFATLLGARLRPEAVINAEAERVRGLRALFGGLILSAIERGHDDD